MTVERIGIFFGPFPDGRPDTATLAKLKDNLPQNGIGHVADLTSQIENESRQEIASAALEHNLGAVVLCGAPYSSSQNYIMVGTNGDSRALPLVQVNLREPFTQNTNEAAFAKAERLLTLAVTRARLAQPITLGHVTANRRVLVIGGNMAAYKTAETIVNAGFPVSLMKTPLSEAELLPPDPALIKTVESQENIEIIEGAVLRHLSGSVGDFHASFMQNGERLRLTAGAVVITADAKTGPLPKDAPAALPLGTFLAETQPGQDAVGIWLDHSGPEGRYASYAAVQAARHHQEAGGKAYVLLRNVSTYGLEGQSDYDAARDAGVTLLRYADTPPSFEKDGDGYLASLKDAILPEREIQVKIDRLFASGPAIPALHNPAVAKLLRLPTDSEGFLQPANVRHLPVASARRGVYFVHMCRNDFGPEMLTTQADAVTAELLTALPHGEIVSPLGRVHVDKGKCASCLTCLRLCPHGAIESYLDVSSITILSSACWECGICAGACPGRAIEHDGITHEQLAETVKLAAAPLNDTPPLVAFACQSSGIAAIDAATRAGLSLPPEALVIDVPCAGRVDETTLSLALECGARSVLVLGCHSDNCRSLKGNRVGGERVARVKAMMSEIAQPGVNVQFHSIAANEPYRLVQILNDALAEPVAEADTQAQA